MLLAFNCVFSVLGLHEQVQPQGVYAAAAVRVPGCADVPRASISWSCSREVVRRRLDAAEVSEEWWERSGSGAETSATAVRAVVGGGASIQRVEVAGGSNGWPHLQRLPPPQRQGQLLLAKNQRSRSCDST